MRRLVFHYRTLRGRGHRNYVVSSADGEDVCSQLNALGAYSVLDGVQTFLSQGNKNGENSEEFKANVMLSEGILATQRHYSAVPKRLFMIGDTESDMRSCVLAKEIVGDYLFNPADRPRIVSVLFDPQKRNGHITADYKIAELRAVLYI